MFKVIKKPYRTVKICFQPIVTAKKQHLFNGPLSGTTWVSRYQKGKINRDLLEQQIVNGSGISWAICKYAPCPRQITTPASHHSVYRLDALLPPNQQHQSTEGKLLLLLC